MTAAISPTDGASLARLAAHAVGSRLVGRAPEPSTPVAPALLAPGASFVTLERGGSLRGCVGTLMPARPLYRDVVRNALRAMVDPRLPPVTCDDWPDLDVKVSVLSGSQQVPAASVDELAAALRPGIDGLLLIDGARRATFLPAVWQKLAEPDRFVAALLVKGGWPAACWPPGMTAHRYTSAEFRDPAPRAALGQAFPLEGH
jgi:uncharacterized protein